MAATATKQWAWSKDEVATLRRLYRRTPAHQIAEMLGRTAAAVTAKAISLHLARPKTRPDAAFQSQLQAFNAQGYPDHKIASLMGCSMAMVHRWRKRLGLPSNQYGEHFRARKRENYAAHAAATGMRPCEHRSLSIRRFAVESGWPEDLRLRAVQILNALADRGPMTRRQIASAIGARWEGRVAPLASDDREGSYLANLIRRGLVVSLGRIGVGETPRQHCHLYSLAFVAERGCVDVAV